MEHLTFDSKAMELESSQSHRIHGTGRFTYIYHKKSIKCRYIYTVYIYVYTIAWVLWERSKDQFFIGFSGKNFGSWRDDDERTDEIQPSVLEMEKDKLIL